MSVLRIVLFILVLTGCSKPADNHEQRVAVARADISWLNQFVEEFQRKKGRLPATLLELGDLKSRIKKTPLDPWSHPYEYEVQGSEFHIYSLGADGNPGGEGENADIQIMAK